MALSPRLINSSLTPVYISLTTLLHTYRLAYPFASKGEYGGLGFVIAPKGWNLLILVFHPTMTSLLSVLDILPEQQDRHDPLLIGLVKEIHNAGFGVPEGYKHRFIGVYIPPPSGETIRKPFPSSPYHECPKPFHTRRLHDSKRRGLPVSKKRKIRQITLSTH